VTVSDIYRAWERLAELEETAWSPDGYVTVSVNARGELNQLALDPRLYRHADATALARTIRDTVAEASSLVQDRTRALVAPFLPRTAPEDVDLAFGPLLYHLDPHREHSDGRPRRYGHDHRAGD
jgi:DNA-binding protein YbaB